mmetsp:Transcript_35453/g.76690  ORF Transcript_35453/g.76690 Transcript_35453/m.76690 type:complete len:200 (+) Transcript_35453:1676-2275(+)
MWRNFTGCPLSRTMLAERSNKPTSSSSAERLKDGVKIVKGASCSVGGSFCSNPFSSLNSSRKCSGINSRQDTPSLKVMEAMWSCRSLTSRMRQLRLLKGRCSCILGRSFLTFLSANLPVLNCGALSCTSLRPCTVYQSHSSPSRGSPYFPTQPGFILGGRNLSRLGYKGCGAHFFFPLPSSSSDSSPSSASFASSSNSS